MVETISIIVPIFNEEKILARRREFWRDLAASAELIFVDGGSSDRSAEIGRGAGKVVSCRKGRAAQMNAGGREAARDILLFLHADCYLEKTAPAAIAAAVQKRDMAGGCLWQVIDAPGVFYQWIAWTGNLRAGLSKVFYGDQGIFVRKDVFFNMGGFPDVPLCEDVFFSRRLKQEGQTGVLKEKIFVSSRRWEEQGICKTLWMNARISRRLLFKQDPEKFAKLYQDIR